MMRSLALPRALRLAVLVTLVSVLTIATVACGTTPAASAATAGAASGAASGAGDAESKAAARAQLEALASAAVGFETQHGRCPGNVEELTSPAPVDPWGSPIAFMPKGPENPQSAFVSSGPDKELLTADDITVAVTCMGG